MIMPNNKADAEMLVAQGILALVAYRDGEICGDAFDSILGSVPWMDCLALINDCPHKAEEELKQLIQRSREAYE